MAYELHFLSALFQTIVIETLVLIGIVRLLFKINKEVLSYRILIFTGFVASGATLPYVWFIFPVVINSYNARVVTSEVFAVAVETAIIAAFLHLNVKESFVVSLLCNTTSFFLGILIFH